MPRKRYVVIGEGAAGLAAAEELRRLAPHALVGLFTDEPHPGYFRAALTNFLLGELREDQLFVNAPDFYEALTIRRAFARVLSVDPARGHLWNTSSSDPTPFDGLIVASGARPRPAPFEGGLLPGVVTLRTLHDARLLMDWLSLGRLERVVVVGGGPLGLEWAHALLERGARVTLVERAGRLLPSALDEVASDLLAVRLKSAGIEVNLGDQILAAYPDAAGNVAGVRLASGRDVPCTLVAVALGVVPNTEYLANSGITLGGDGALLVDKSLVSSVPNVWAAGDVARVDGEQLALWEPARRQGRIAAQNLLGGSALYEPGAFYFATRLFDLDFAKVGDIQRKAEREEIVDFPRGTGTIAYRKLVLQGGRLIGALMLGERAMHVRAFGRTLKRLIDTGADISAIKGRIWSNSFDLEAWLTTWKLLEKPRVAAVHAAVPARVRGTQALQLASTGTAVIASGRALAPPSAGTSSLPAAGGQHAPRRTKQLSIGLPAEAPGVLEPPSTHALGARVERHGESIPIERALINLGAAPESDIRLRAARAGALHAQIFEHGGAFYLRDMGSHIGTYINGDPLTRVHRLIDGDRIQIVGETLVFRHASAPAPAAPTYTAVAAPRLTVRSGAQFGLKLKLLDRPIVIGRGLTANLRLGDAGVLPEHVRVRPEAGAFWVEALATGSLTLLNGSPIPVGRAFPLMEGSVLGLGSVELVYSEAEAEEAARALAPALRLTIDAGPNAGHATSIRGRVLVGSGPNVNVCIGGLDPVHLEIAEHGPAFWVRDLTPGKTFRAGRPLGAEFVALEHGDLLLAGPGVLLRFEET